MNSFCRRKSLRPSHIHLSLSLSFSFFLPSSVSDALYDVISFITNCKYYDGVALIQWQRHESSDRIHILYSKAKCFILFSLPAISHRSPFTSLSTCSSQQLQCRRLRGKRGLYLQGYKLHLQLQTQPRYSSADKTNI